jgi:hypothetical protein
LGRAVGWIANRHCGVVQHEHWECFRVHTILRQLRERAGHDEIDQVDVDNAKRRARVCKKPRIDRQAICGRDINHDRVKHHRAEPHMIVLPVNDVP